ncbi:MAG TPA: tetratricopeptide repeat protein [Polyangia bacterium]
MRLAVVLLVSTALVTPARASGADDEERARGHYEIGLGLYRLGDYQGALKEFAAGYELARKPGFLLNLGQTYRKLGELREARDMYRQFLAEVARDDPARPEARKVLAEIEQAIRKSPPPDSSSPSSSAAATPEPAPAVAAPAVTAPAVSAPAEPAPVAVQATAPPHQHRRALRIGGIVVGVVGVGLLGGGIGTAVAADGIARDLNSADRSGAVFDPSQDHAYSVDRALSTGFFVSGAALAATGAILLVVSAR